MCSLYSYILGQCVDQVAASLQCGDIQTAQEIVSFFVNSPRQVDTGTINWCFKKVHPKVSNHREGPY